MENRLSNRHPTQEELYAYVSAARRLRAQEMARMFGAGLTAIKSLFGTRRTGTRASTHGVSHA